MLLVPQLGPRRLGRFGRRYPELRAAPVKHDEQLQTAAFGPSDAEGL
jgi:hypothetical protein